jgi:N-acetylated-alpha-linked acidic dipeptidase
MMEMTRALGELKKQGLRPRRTLVICSWDGEEVALTGSTEWGEQFADELKKKAVVYINVDSSTSGPDFRPSAVASFAPLIVETSRGLAAPSGKTLYAEWKQSLAREQKTKRPAKDDKMVDTKIGSGSDHTVFLNFLGMPTILLQFDGPYGVYHSAYDNFYWMNNFGDPGYRYHTLMSVFWGVLALRIANAEILPLDFEFYSRNIRQFVIELQKQNDMKGQVNLQSTLRLIAEFEAAGLALNRAIQASLAKGRPDGRTAERVNQMLMQVETNWLNAEGIPGRPWFKHILYAARYTYAHLELPGLTEAVEQKNWRVADQQRHILEAAIAKNTALLVAARDELSKAK